MLTYADGMAIELFDHVEFVDAHGFTIDGQVTRLHPRLFEVRVRYHDPHDVNRAGDGRWTSARLPAARIDLIRRDG